METKSDPSLLGKKLRSFDPQKGTSRLLFEEDSVEFSLAPDGDVFCAAEFNPPGRLLCGPIGGELAEVDRSPQYQVKSTLLGGRKIIVEGSGTHPLRLVDLRKKTAVALVFKGSELVVPTAQVGSRYVVGVVDPVNGSRGIWIDLEERRYFITDRSWLDLDPANGRHIVRTVGATMQRTHEDVYEASVQ